MHTQNIHRHEFRGARGHVHTQYHVSKSPLKINADSGVDWRMTTVARRLWENPQQLHLKPSIRPMV